MRRVLYLRSLMASDNEKLHVLCCYVSASIHKVSVVRHHFTSIHKVSIPDTSTSPF
ncbi:hypothetical protein MtrunA17_Chr3g0116261 [Medicago truncatula]|uniref:Uncharacterized protein n=1 Tax=Medicago truncatula TaxID=3880 RepID=A0A396ISG3_MEDTR|nr:hypothetical protein MtrunA17_Chr3g0116261 [Medicago truncatula]